MRVEQNYSYLNNIYANNTKKQANVGESTFVSQLKEKEEMSLDEYKVYFKEKMDALYTSPTQRNRNWVIDITDSAYERMKNDPEYEQKILDALAKNKAYNFGKYIPSFSYTHIDDTWEKCYAYTYGMEDNYQTSSKSSGGGLGEWWEERHKRMKELLEESVATAQKRAQLNKELAQQTYLNRIDQRTMINRKILAVEAYEKQVAEEHPDKLVAGESDIL